MPPEGWAGRLTAIVVAGLTAVIALTSSNVRPGRVRLAALAALVAIVAAALANAVSSNGLLGAAFIIDALLLTVAAVTILRRVVLAAQVDFQTILGAISVFTLLACCSRTCSWRSDACTAARCSPVSRTRPLGTTCSSATRR